MIRECVIRPIGSRCKRNRGGCGFAVMGVEDAAVRAAQVRCTHDIKSTRAAHPSEVATRLLLSRWEQAARIEELSQRRA